MKSKTIIYRIPYILQYLPSWPVVVLLLAIVGEFVVSAFKDGRLAGGRRADGTLPKLCIPCLRGTWFFCAEGSVVSPYTQKKYNKIKNNTHTHIYNNANY